MKVGVPKEIKQSEFRVGLTPASVRELVSAGHDVLVESAAGSGIGFEDADYESAGALIAACAEEVFAKSELVDPDRTSADLAFPTKYRSGRGPLCASLAPVPGPSSSNDPVDAETSIVMSRASELPEGATAATRRRLTAQERRKRT